MKDVNALSPYIIEMILRFSAVKGLGLFGMPQLYLYCMLAEALKPTYVHVCFKATATVFIHSRVDHTT